MTELSIFSAFLVGLLGGVHCAGMCGGIVGAISLHSTATAARPGYHLAYNAGRIGSYALAGIAAGSIGSGGLLLEGLLPVRTILYLLASSIVLAQGFYLAGLGRGVVYLERAGGRFWSYIQPWSRRLLPLDSAPKAFLLGALWGWLPCGMVYSVLATALASGHPMSGGLTMLAFGLGTAPNLLAMGLAAERLRPMLKQGRLRLAAGALVMGFGVIGLVRAMQPAHDPGAAPSSPGSHAHVRAGH
jgi:sulfite exporter TauE/SafE